MMIGLQYLFLVSLSVCVATNRVYPATKVIKLTFGVSKAAYLPLEGERFIQNGHIIENELKIMKLFGFIPWPQKYNPAADKRACDVGQWTAKSFENEETEVIMFKSEQQKLAVFGFRGTEPLNLIDWMKDFEMQLVKSSIGKATFTTHKGFKDRYGFIASWFEREYKAVPQDYTIVLTGHSLGAAEVTIAAVYAAGKLKRRPDAVVTYGSPRVGKVDFRRYYNKVVGCDRTLRIVAKGDPITDVPLFFGYTHVCSETKVDGKTGSSVIDAHNLYTGYEKGIKSKYKDVKEINLGCDQVLN